VPAANVKSLAVALLDKTGAAWFTRPLYAGIGVILGYHRVIAPDQPSLMPGNDITAELLGQTLEFLKRKNYDFLALGEIPARLKSRATNRFAAITFDDGFEDNLTRGLPVLRSFNAPFTISPVTGVLDRKHMAWWQVIEELVLRNDELTLDYPTAGRRVFNCRSWTDKVNSYNEIARWGWQNPTQFTAELRNAATRAGANAEDLSLNNMLTWQQMREMARDPLVSFGIHTMSHAGLTRLDDEGVAEEIGGAKRRLEAELGTTIDTIAYPFGWAREREFRIAKECGIRVGVTTQRGTIRRGVSDDPLSLPRVLPSMAAHAATMSFVRISVYGLWNQLLPQHPTG
jgi:peptidoglycan/xylan/chitin deacetylase (PgdA/CDA1 family)